MIVKFLEKIPVAKDISTFKWQPPESVDYIPGQFIKLILPHDNPDERGVMHFFTLSSSPSEDHLANTTKYAGDDKSSTFKKTLFTLKPGTEVKMTNPSGDFTLPQDESRPLLFVAGGIGVTPYRSIIKWLSDTNQRRPIHLLYAAAEPDYLAFRDLFDSLDWLKTTYVVSESTPDWPLDSARGKHETGQLDGRRIKELAGGFDNKLVYLSGPEPMIEAFKKQLLALKLPEIQIKTDFFPGYTHI